MLPTVELFQKPLPPSGQCSACTQVIDKARSEFCLSEHEQRPLLTPRCVAAPTPSNQPRQTGTGSAAQWRCLSPFVAALASATASPLRYAQWHLRNFLQNYYPKGGQRLEARHPPSHQRTQMRFLKNAAY